MSGLGFVYDGAFRVAAVCISGPPHLHLVDAHLDGPTGIAAGRHVTSFRSMIATHSGASGLLPQRSSKFPRVGRDHPLNNLLSQLVRNSLTSPMANLGWCARYFEACRGPANAEAQARRLD